MDCTKSYTRLPQPSPIDKQHGFHYGCSTTTCYTVLTFYMYDSFRGHDKFDTIYSDLSKAFDWVGQFLLIETI